MAEEQGPPDIIRIIPGGLITSKPAHLIGHRGAAPSPVVPATIDGFQNLIQLNDDVAWSLLNGATDEIARNGIARLFLGGAVNLVDVPTDPILSSILSLAIESPNAATQKLNAYGEISNGAATDGTNYGAYSEPFTTAGTVTVTAGSNIVAGAGTAWTTDQLTGGYGYVPGRISLNLIRAGDIIGVGVAGSRVWFRIASSAITANQLLIYPTPTVTNPAIGAGKAYVIRRTGFGSYSRVVKIEGTGGATDVHAYYAGNVFNGQINGSIEEVQADAAAGAGNGGHHMAPYTVDSAGVAIAPIEANDIIMYKGFLLYGAGKSIGWSIAGFPSVFPFGVNDFPAQNVSAIDVTSKFVSFEFLGDQPVALFEDSMWLVSATGVVPEFTFYKMPELISVVHAARTLSPIVGPDALAYGRPSCSGRGAFFYVSNRGIESNSGALSTEISQPVSDAITKLEGSGPYFLSWDGAFDLMFARAAFPIGSGEPSLVYSGSTGQWSSVIVAPVTGTAVLGVTAGSDPKTRQNDQPRLMHLGYYEVIVPGGAPGTNGADVRHLTTGLDRPLQTPGLVPWIWNTPVIPIGLNYPDFSFGGFILDAMTTDAGAATVSWTLYSGSSPYNMVQRQTDAITYVGSVRKATWISSLDRKGKKEDLAFIQFRFTSFNWVQLAGLILFNSKTQAKR